MMTNDTIKASTFKPMLSAKLEQPQFPYLASPKLDGIRCVIRDGVALSRTLKPIPNKNIQAILGNPLFNGFDGEIICGKPTAPDCFRNTTTIAMSHDKVAEFMFYVFDDTELSAPFKTRIAQVSSRVEGLNHKNITAVPHVQLTNRQQFDDLEIKYLTDGYEGMMVRAPNGAYKFGRATAKSHALSKVKRFQDSEAIVIAVEELRRNENPAETDATGHSHRSSNKENKHGAGIMGALTVRDVETGIEFNIGTGFDAQQRDEIWADRDNIIGKTLTYKSFHIGVKEKPRHPVFKFWRQAGF